MLNGFRWAGDICHIMALTILLGHIFRFRNKSCAGVSGKSRILYTIVYLTRYLDLFSQPITINNSFLKIFLISSSLIIIYLLYFQYEHDKDNDTTRIEFFIGIGLTLILTLALCFHCKFTYEEILWTFSNYLESVAILPQLVLTSKLEKAEGFMLHYLIALGSYRIFYIANFWYYGDVHKNHYDVIDTAGGIIQMALYCGFFFTFIFRKTTDEQEKWQKEREKINIFTVPVDEGNTNRLLMWLWILKECFYLMKMKTMNISDKKEELNVELEG